MQAATVCPSGSVSWRKRKPTWIKRMANKNTVYRELLSAAKRNQIPFRYVLSDVWYSAAENMLFIKHDLDKDFIMPLKANRKVALSEQAKRDGQWVRLDQLTLEANTCVEIYLESVDFPLRLIKQVF